MRMPSMRESRDSVRFSNQHTSTITCVAAPRVWHFSAFHWASYGKFLNMITPSKANWTIIVAKQHCSFDHPLVLQLKLHGYKHVSHITCQHPSPSLRTGWSCQNMIAAQAVNLIAYAVLYSCITMAHQICSVPWAPGMVSSKIRVSQYFL